MFWSVVQIHPQAARRVEINLQRQGFEFYDPVVLERVRRGSRWVERRSQLFPGYMFVWIVDRWRAVTSTYGVLRLLMSESEKPAVISSEFVDGIKASEDTKSGLIVLGRRDKFVLGQEVKFIDGPYASKIGIYEGQRGSDRVAVMMDSFGRVRVNPDSLVAA